jgi:hypothetical protein
MPETVMDLMSCQMCGGKAYYGFENDSSWIECGGCGTCSGNVGINACDGGMTTEQVKTHQEQNDGRTPSDLEAGRRWNRMQSLIAKGLLIEEGTAGGREVKGRL